ncbi:hypothetical protein COU76_01930 [Candidatus Peregrinibacteria bacterium CG10_big_fil_rev_8_21_14_0_10_49_10]|nr:MAG: hypothetical protein COU76_01930 [Candidatus Peregrinibacteria bacterium CG10_big_fil_rev_8_21_14_0_10_49_10]
MALRLPNSVFIHVPKTGGTWVHSALKAAQVPAQELGCRWHAGYLRDEPFHSCKHNAVNQVDTQGKFSFGFVRHPATYYQSFWCFRMRRGWVETNYFQRTLKNDSFEDFVRGVLSNRPGWVSHLFQGLLEGGGKSVDFIGKQENLVDDLITALHRAGESFDEAAIRNHPPKNVSSGLDEWKQRCVYSASLIREVERVERYAMERFEYPSMVRKHVPVHSVWH